jgi:hypothetical protein
VLLDAGSSRLSWASGYQAQGFWQELGLDVNDDSPSSAELWNQMLGTGEDQLSSLLFSEQQFLDQLDLRTSKRVVPVGDQSLSTSKSYGIPLRWKYALTRAHTVTLIAFLRSMTKSRLPDESNSLQMNLDTLQFIMPSTLSRFSSPDVQALLVELLETVVDGLYHNYGDSPSIVPDIIDVLFDVLGTVGDAPSSVHAKALVSRHLIRQPWCEGALRARRQVIFLISPIVCMLADVFFSFRISSP